MCRFSETRVCPRSLFGAVSTLNCPQRRVDLSLANETTRRFSNPGDDIVGADTTTPETAAGSGAQKESP